MAHPKIIYHNVPLVEHVSSATATFTFHERSRILRCRSDALPWAGSPLQQITSNRSVDKFIGPWSARPVDNSNLNAGVYFAAFITAAGGAGSTNSVAGGSNGSGSAAGVSGPVSAAVFLPFAPQFFATTRQVSDSAENFPTTTEIMVCRAAAVVNLDKPPQESAFPRVAREWATYPKISLSGDFLGATSRPRTGTLNIEIKNQPHRWIEEIWEPFREHAARGGSFAYVNDIDAIPPGAIDANSTANMQNVAYCFAAESIPAPVMRAGGFGDVTLRAGVVRGL